MIIEKEQTRKDGGVAQLGEHLPCKQGVMGSNPIISTIFKTEPQSGCGLEIEKPKSGKMEGTNYQVSEKNRFGAQVVRAHA